MNTLSTQSIEHTKHRTLESDGNSTNEIHMTSSSHSAEHVKNTETHTRTQEEYRANLDAHNAALHAHEYRTSREERSPAERRGPVTKKQLTREFNHTIQHIQAEMTPSQRAFSKLIHIPAIEKTSDVLSVTIARPNALLAGSVCAFSLTLGIYLFSKSVGYSLSGFEPIAAFITGWLIGMLYDYLRVMVTGRHR